MTTVAAHVSRLWRRARPSPRALSMGAAAVLGLAILLVTVLIAAGVPLGSWLDGLPGAHTVDLEVGEGHLAPFRVEAIRELLGPRAAEALFGPGAPSGPTSGSSPTQPQSGAGGGGGGGGAAPPPQRSALAPLLAPGSWVLTVEMAADRSTVEPTEEIRYAITVRNVGAEPFPAGTNFDLQWHIPPGTFNSTPLKCTPPGFPVNLDDLCPPVAIPFPGTSTTSHGSMNSLGLISIPPGGTFVREVRVTVATSTEPDRTIHNHAHLDVTGDGAPAITSNEVIVTVVAPESPAPPGVPG